MAPSENWIFEMSAKIQLDLYKKPTKIQLDSNWELTIFQLEFRSLATVASRNSSQDPTGFQLTFDYIPIGISRPWLLSLLRIPAKSQLSLLRIPAKSQLESSWRLPTIQWNSSGLWRGKSIPGGNSSRDPTGFQLDSGYIPIGISV